jgi:uncharacterized YccA/Bax inhibitor family protein
MASDWLRNPVVRNGEDDFALGKSEPRFTLTGAAFKTLFLLAIMGGTFFYTWNLTTAGYHSAFTTPDTGGQLPTQVSIPNNVYGIAAGGALGAFVVAILTIFWQRLSPVTAPVYAALEGLALGAISAAFEAKYPGIVMEAMASTFGVAASMLFLYGTGILRPTQKFAVGIIAAMFGILIVYLVDIVMHMFGGYVPVVHQGGTWGVLFSVFVVSIAALSLILDFEDFRLAAEDKAPKWYEWYAGFGLMVTLVWLYLEVLRLWAKTKE